jgi:hypothetical protein
MVRLVSVALLVAAVATAGWSQSTGPATKQVSPEAWRVGETAPRQSPFTLDVGALVWNDADTPLFAGTEVSPNSRLGLGVFGHKRDRTALPPATVYEVYTRQSRKPGLGFILKF